MTKFLYLCELLVFFLEIYPFFWFSRTEVNFFFTKIRLFLPSFSLSSTIYIWCARTNRRPQGCLIDLNKPLFFSFLFSNIAPKPREILQTIKHKGDILLHLGQHITKIPQTFVLPPAGKVSFSQSRDSYFRKNSRPLSIRFSRLKLKQRRYFK